MSFRFEDKDIKSRKLSVSKNKKKLLSSVMYVQTIVGMKIKKENKEEIWEEEKNCASPGNRTRGTRMGILYVTTTLATHEIKLENVYT